MAGPVGARPACGSHLRDIDRLRYVRRCLGRDHLPRGLFGILSHAFDLLIFSIIIFFTLGPTSPFFVFFVFSIICATLRWQWQGALWTTVASLSAVVGMALYPADLLRDPDFEMNRFIMRVVYLAVVGSLLGYVGAHEQTRRRELSGLAAWPHGVPDDSPGLARQVLEFSAGILSAPRIFLAWEEQEEPWLYLASWARGTFEYTREAPGALGSMVAESLAGKSFFCPDAKRAEPAVVYASPSGLQRWRGAPLQPEMQERVRAKAVLALRLPGGNARGYLFALDKARMTSDDLVLGEIAAQGVASQLDHFYLLQQLRDAAAAEERVHLARDLHDGLLQSLTSVALYLEAAQRLGKLLAIQG
jgi:signal transduction histidine kinase